MVGRRMARLGAVIVVLLIATTCTGYAAPRHEARPDAAAPSAGSAVLACTNAQKVASWGLRRLAEQVVVVPVLETQVRTVAGLVAEGAGGVILFGSRAPTDLRSQLDAITSQAPHGIAPLVMTDEEGGAVQRMANLVGTMPSARRMAATMTPRQVRHLARTVGSRMRAAGVTMDLAPVLDLDNRPGPSSTNPDGTRSFSLDPAVATRYGLAFARGLQAAGVVPVVKHFPGLGYATANTDLAPAWTRPWSQLQHAGLLPFTAAVDGGLPAVMVANARVPGLTSVPATLSYKAVRGVLRARLGFRGLVLTDSLSAVAVRAAGYTVPAASVRALSAGSDMVLFNADAGAVAGLTHRTVDAIVAAVGSGALSRGRLENAVLHVLRAKGVDLCS